MGRSLISFIKVAFCIGLFYCHKMSGQDLGIMTYNIRLDLSSDGKNAWGERSREVVDLIEYYRPEILGVQEALPSQMDALSTALPKYSFVGVGRDDGNRAGEFSAIFYNRERLKILDSGTFWLSDTPETPSKGWDAAYNRVCSYAFFKDKHTGRKFWAFNAHFDHVGVQARMRSTELILDRIRELTRERVPVVLMGDFNSTPESKPISNLNSYLSDAHSVSEQKPYGPAGTYNAFDTERKEFERIDYIFVKGFKVKSHRTIEDRRDNFLYPSDHFPVLVVVHQK